MKNRLSMGLILVLCVLIAMPIGLAAAQNDTAPQNPAPLLQATPTNTPIFWVTDNLAHGEKYYHQSGCGTACNLVPDHQIDTTNACGSGKVVGFTMSVSMDSVGWGYPLQAIGWVVGNGHYGNPDNYSHWEGWWTTPSLEPSHPEVDWGPINAQMYGNIAGAMDSFTPGLVTASARTNADINAWLTVEGMKMICEGGWQPKITATPTPFCQDAIGAYKTVDLLPIESNVSGSREAAQTVIDGNVYYVIDYSLTAPVPAMLDGYNQGTISLGINDPGGHRDNNLPARYTVTVNGNTFSSTSGGDPSNTGDTGPTVPVALGGGTALTVSIHAEIPGSPSTIETMSLVSLAARVPTYLDPGNNLLCDAGMEQYPLSEYWKSTGDGDFGRLNKALDIRGDTAANGFAICNAGMQAIGSYGSVLTSVRTGSSIEQPFHWDGGVAQWKFQIAGGHSGASGHVWIKDNAGTNVADLFGSATDYFAGFLAPWILTAPWIQKTGSLDLDAGDYKLVLDSGPMIDGQTVYYDDVAIGSQIDTACQEDLQTLPTANTQTPTATQQNTPTPTSTYQLTRIVTKTPTITATRPTATITTTARPTRTATSLPSTSTPIPSFTPRPTNTPYGTPGGPEGPHTSTPNPNATGTPGTQGTPSGWWGGDMPQEGGMNPGTGQCSRPPNPWSIAWWVDYEFCRLFYSVSWQPYHSATLVAIPTLMSDREPVRSIGQIRDGVSAAQTEIATYTAGSVSMVQSSDKPDPGIFKPQPDSPWDGQWKFQFGPQQAQASTSRFSMYCTNKMTTVLGKMLSPGFCFVLNLFRDLGLLIWFQFILYLAMGAWTIRNIMKTIQFYPLMQDIKSDDD